MMNVKKSYTAIGIECFHSRIQNNSLGLHYHSVTYKNIESQSHIPKTNIIL